MRKRTKSLPGPCLRHPGLLKVMKNRSMIALARFDNKTHCPRAILLNH